MKNKNNARRIVKYWLDLSNYDFITAKFMLKTKRYPYCLFMCHLSVEKLLKALMVKITGKHAPYSHNLVDLAKRTGIEFKKEEYKMLLSDLTEFNLEARYPEWQKKFYLRCSKQYTDDYFQKTKKFQKWLKKYL